MENLPETTNNHISQGCGPDTHINVQVSPTTGGEFYISLESHSTVENLKKLISKKLKVPRDRICLLFRDKQLQDGNLYQHGIADGSKITLLPNVETGLINQRPEIGIMQALESLNDTQVNEFLCGKAPLNLSMRLGDHMMLIQLQLSTVALSSKPSNCAPLVHSPGPPSLIQASKNLQHTLRKLSADIFAGREKTRNKGGRRENVYSGTFSGALSPTLQDSRGRPRRDVATIVHILNDLLCSVPELRGIQNKGSEEPTISLSEDVQPEEVSTCSSYFNRSEPGSSSSTSSSYSTILHHEDQNLVTRNKLDQLRLVMGERKERRRQRKAKPYVLPHQTDSDSVTA
ncbi:midnolin-A [Anthonomus grandis grandis]|uniref:midnolin-A n=1 Tax=Anthonomus grandis grandis TaxID=2921223 RepID=UPI0021651C15|nr:midnolin-A [Anthonomus grandis grandis]XP_050313302.1 midnolin-A [Anthonomus grandis grandis]